MVNVSTLNENHLVEIKQKTIDRIKKYIQDKNKENKAFKFISANVLVEKRITTNKFLQLNHVCMNCGEVYIMPPYALAQISLSQKINFTCECGHISILPQI